SAYLDATRERYDAQDPRARNESVFATAQAEAEKGLLALQQWTRHIDDTELVPDFQGATLSRLISRPRVVATQLVLATLIGAVVCLGLAAYLTASLRRLREATVAFGSGDFSHRVAPTLGKRRDEIFDLAQSLDTMAERIDALINSQRSLLRDVSHELRSPLARVQVAVGLARQRVGNLADEELQRIDSEMERLNELIGRIIDFSRLDAGLNTLRSESVRLEQLLADSIADAQLEADRKHCEIVAELPDEALFDGDVQLLSSAIENVLRNAVRHSPQNGLIKVTLKQLDSAWQIDISDQGPGIPPELLQKVFEPFFRVDDHRNPQGGIGLGLAIALKAIAAHDGSIALHNIKNGGLQVTLRLPISSSSEKATS
ncbi:MAG TPA: ATP-binding protein, partial [Rhodocyclaceae bacterium]|nr:ATP-binding protein [Rhodocyclaceae bacterium]